MTSFLVSGYGLWAFWFLAAFAVGFGVFLTKGSDAASSYAAGYLLEMSLSVDNFCAFLLLFKVFNVRCGCSSLSASDIPCTTCMGTSALSASGIHAARRCRRLIPTIKVGFFSGGSSGLGLCAGYL